MGQLELFVEKGDGRLKAHLLCPDEGSCLQKVITKCSSGRDRYADSLCHVSKSKTSKVDSCGPDPLYPRSVLLLCTVLSTLFRKEEWRESAHFLLPGIAEGPPSAPTNVRLHERPAGCFMRAGLPSDQKERRATKCSARRCSF